MTQPSRRNRGRRIAAAVLLTSLAAAACARCDGGFASVALDEAEKCARSAADLWPCLKRGGVRAASAALDYRGEIPLFGRYLSVVPDAAERAAAGPSADDEGRPRRDAAAANATAAAPSPLSVYAKLTAFAGERSLRVTLPVRFVTWLIGATGAAADEPRGKKDKGAGVFMLGGMMMMTTLMSTAFGALALMAAKGLMTSVLALMLSAMAVSKKSGHGHARTTYEVINGPASGYVQASSDYKLENGAAVVPDVSVTKKKKKKEYGDLAERVGHSSGRVTVSGG